MTVSLLKRPWFGEWDRFILKLLPCQLFAMDYWASFLASMNLSFLICNNGPAQGFPSYRDLKHVCAPSHDHCTLSYMWAKEKHGSVSVGKQAYGNKDWELDWLIFSSFYTAPHYSVSSITALTARSHLGSYPTYFRPSVDQKFFVSICQALGISAWAWSQCRWWDGGSVHVNSVRERAMVTLSSVLPKSSVLSRLWLEAMAPVTPIVFS